MNTMFGVLALPLGDGRPVWGVARFPDHSAAAPRHSRANLRRFISAPPKAAHPDKRASEESWHVSDVRPFCCAPPRDYVDGSRNKFLCENPGPWRGPDGWSPPCLAEKPGEWPRTCDNKRDSGSPCKQLRETQYRHLPGLFPSQETYGACRPDLRKKHIRRPAPPTPVRSSVALRTIPPAIHRPAGSED